MFWKIKDEASSDEEDADPESRRNNGDDEEDGSRQSTNKKKPNKKTKNGDNKRKDKRQRVDNADEVAAYESEDGQDEGREYDYISDSGSNTRLVSFLLQYINNSKFKTLLTH